MTTAPHTPHSPEFVATRWSMVLAAANLQAPSQAHHALAELAQAYWFPLYAYSRRQGKSAAEAEDLTQAFFTRLIEKNTIRTADRTKGKFRSFLLASFRHFLINEYEKSTAQKRGHNKIIPLSSTEAETRYHQASADTLSPERVYEQRWAWAMLDQVLATLRQQYHDRGQGPVFEALKGTLTAPAESAHIDLLAKNLTMTSDAVGVAIHRLRRRYRDAIRAEIAQTVADPSLIDEEIQYLLACL